jgi:hypothetical protein
MILEDSSMDSNDSRLNKGRRGAKLFAMDFYFRVICAIKNT